MLEGGRSSAAVYCVHVDVNANASFEPGEYILKLDEPREYSKPAPTERELHTIAEGRNRAFTAKHIPTLVRDVAMDGRIAMLYNLAGSGLSSVSTPYSLGTGLLSEQCRVISRELLEDFNFDVVTEAAVTARSTLELLLGYRLDPDAGRPLHDFVHDECGGHSSLLVSGRLLANALWFCNAACIRDDVGRVRFGYSEVLGIGPAKSRLRHRPQRLSICVPRSAVDAEISSLKWLVVAANIQVMLKPCDVTLLPVIALKFVQNLDEHFQNRSRVVSANAVKLLIDIE